MNRGMIGAFDTEPAAAAGDAVPAGQKMSKHGGFAVNLPVYAGPLEALLSLIANRRLEVTELSLSTITGEFLDYVRGLSLIDDVDEASSFVDVASILLEAKSASLLPHADSNDVDDQTLEALRERDLLFARLLQYRAFKQAATDFGSRLDAHTVRYNHHGLADANGAYDNSEQPAGFSPTKMLPTLIWELDPEQFARLAASVFTDAPIQHVSVKQLHVPAVDLQVQAKLIADRLRALTPDESLTFAELTNDAANVLEVVARFLAVLVFFKQGSLQFRQAGPFEQLDLRWVHGSDDETLKVPEIGERA